MGLADPPGRPALAGVPALPTMQNRLGNWRAAIAALALAVAAGPGKAADAPAEGTPPVSSDYVIGVEDVLRVVVWGETELTVSVQVRPDGKITVPLVNDVAVVGLTAPEVRERIAAKLEQFIRDVNVTVIVEQINSFRVYFLGEVNTQGALLFHRPTRLLQGIAAAGGLTEFSKKEIVVLREQMGVEKRLTIDYKRLVAGDPREENILLMPGDTLVVN
jgi:polysaccharide export outer membrane protein